MRVKNISTNPIHGIAAGGIGELPKEREHKIKRYIELGMLEVIDEPKDEPKGTAKAKAK